MNYNGFMETVNAIDRQEHMIIPFHASEPIGRRILVLAPHPDDETLGCGGTLKLLAQAGSPISVVFITRGEKADPLVKDTERYALVREKEAVQALKILGVSQYTFLRLPDREVCYNINEMKERIQSIIETFCPDTIYSPSLIELNPDHRATATVAMEVGQERNQKIIFYEITVPIRPNLLINISKVFKAKEKAIKKYKSQIKLLDYLRIIRSLNVFRTLTLGGDVRYSEAFWVVKEKTGDDILKWLSYQCPLII